MCDEREKRLARLRALVARAGDEGAPLPERLSSLRIACKEIDWFSSQLEAAIADNDHFGSRIERRDKGKRRRTNVPIERVAVTVVGRRGGTREVK